MNHPAPAFGVPAPVVAHLSPPQRRYPRDTPLLERIVVDPEIVHGRPVVRGTRMRVADVLALLAAGSSVAEILEDYPYLTEDDIRACLQYAAAQVDHAILITS
ncbi:DUF433 domain-containing protein [Mycobacterium celatum]|uniref:DUF433 domain-containing protein n=2 Tax=Mycobacterium celatum TaxID=28045 RepID=A0A2G5PR87_MYCCE|nr:DUF433 domain-containing protein [Mycobacterium celatum]